MGVIPSVQLTSSIRNQCSRSGISRRSCKLADNDKISFNKERRMALRCYSLSLYIIGNKNRETCLNRQNLRLIMSALRQAFFNAQKFGKKQGLRVPESNAADIYKIDANPVE